MGGIRLQKYLAECGVASRRKAEQIISEGRVAVNGRIVNEMGFKVEPDDVVEVDGRQLYTEEKKVYIMLNKPVGYVTTSRDQFSRKTVIDLVEGISERIYPVGRLDYDTSGLLILSNDGDFTHRLTHPRHEMEKKYIARVQGTPSDEELQKFREGLKIEDYTTAPAKIKVLDKGRETSTLEIIIHEGKNRQVRKMCDAIGHTVLSLQRIEIGGLKLGNLPEGKWRRLLPEEVELLERDSATTNKK